MFQVTPRSKLSAWLWDLRTVNLLRLFYDIECEGKLKLLLTVSTIPLVSSPDRARAGHTLIHHDKEWLLAEH